MNATRHPLDHGWDTPAGYICDGCTVLGLHEHRCHGSDGGPECLCRPCAPPTAAELAAFVAEHVTTGGPTDER